MFLSATEQEMKRADASIVSSDAQSAAELRE